MSDIKVDATEQVAVPEVSAPAVTEEVKVEETKPEEAPAAASNGETKEEAEKKSAFVRKENILKTQAREEGKRNNKFDPSVVAVTDDPKEIRKQV